MRILASLSPLLEAGISELHQNLRCRQFAIYQTFYLYVTRAQITL